MTHIGHLTKLNLLIWRAFRYASLGNHRLSSVSELSAVKPFPLSACHEVRSYPLWYNGFSWSVSSCQMKRRASITTTGMVATERSVEMNVPCTIRRSSRPHCKQNIVPNDPTGMAARMKLMAVTS